MIGSALVVTVLMLLAAVGWWAVVPNWRPPLRIGERYGIDVSHHQGQIDWTEVATDEISFAYIKASEGGDLVDPRFAANWRDAHQAGVERGAYHFFTLCRSGGEQAANFLAVAPPDPAALRPAVDLELAGNCSARPSAESVASELQAFLDPVEAAWQRPALLYVGADFESRYPVADRLSRPLWLVRFLRRPPNDGWVVWQLHGFARVDGIDGRVDLDVGRDPR